MTAPRTWLLAGGVWMTLATLACGSGSKPAQPRAVAAASIAGGTAAAAANGGRAGAALSGAVAGATNLAAAGASSVTPITAAGRSAHAATAGSAGTAPATQAGAGATAAATAGAGTQPGPTPTAMPWKTSGTTCLKAGDGQYGEPGPYKVGMMDVDLGMVQSDQTTGKFTIFYPMPLETDCLHPIIAWGNGTGVNDSTTYAFFNSNAAAWGMVVIASQDPNTGSGAFHKAGLDFLLKQNADPMSMFYGKLSTRAGTSGHSQGAFGSVAGASHPNVSVNVGVGGGASTSAMHASLCLTGTEDIAADSCPALVDRAQGPFFAASWNGGDHVTTETLAGYITRNAGSLAMQRAYAAWFRCFLADDGVACNLWKGATPSDCGLCKEKMDWAVLKSKNIN